MKVANRVPMEEENLLLPSTICGGSPEARYAGTEISPPPPAIESTMPAKKTEGRTIENIFR